MEQFLLAWHLFAFVAACRFHRQQISKFLCRKSELMPLHFRTHFCIHMQNVRNIEMQTQQTDCLAVKIQLAQISQTAVDTEEHAKRMGEANIAEKK